MLCMQGDSANLGYTIGRWLAWLASIQRFDWEMAGVICPVLSVVNRAKQGAIRLMRFNRLFCFVNAFNRR